MSARRQMLFAAATVAVLSNCQKAAVEILEPAPKATLHGHLNMLVRASTDVGGLRAVRWSAGQAGGPLCKFGGSVSEAECASADLIELDDKISGPLKLMVTVEGDQGATAQASVEFTGIPFAQPLWTRNIGQEGLMVSAGDILLMESIQGANAAALVALQPSDGEELWRATMESRLRGIGINGGLVYVTSHPDDQLRAFDLATGELRFSQWMSACVSPPVSYQDGVVTVTVGGHIAHHRPDGTVAWSTTLPGAVGCPVVAPLVRPDDTLLVPMNGGLQEVLAGGAMGALLPLEEAINALLLLPSDQVVLATSNALHLMNRDGTIAWTRLSDRGGATRITLDGETLYGKTGPTGRTTFAISLDGTVQWERETGVGPPVIFGARILAGGNVLDAQGTLQRRVKCDFVHSIGDRAFCVDDALNAFTDAEFALE